MLQSTYSCSVHHSPDSCSVHYFIWKTSQPWLFHSVYIILQIHSVYIILSEKHPNNGCYSLHIHAVYIILQIHSVYIILSEKHPNHGCYSLHIHAVYIILQIHSVYIILFQNILFMAVMSSIFTRLVYIILFENIHPMAVVFQIPLVCMIFIKKKDHCCNAVQIPIKSPSPKDVPEPLNSVAHLWLHKKAHDRIGHCVWDIKMSLTWYRYWQIIES